MVKSRRKHPGFTIIEQTPQGRRFLREVMEMVGGGFEYQPLERLGPSTHVFRIEGNAAWGLLLEGPTTQLDDAYAQEWGFRLVEPVDENVVVQAIFSSHRWDPWLAHGRDDDLVRNASRRQRKEWNEERVRSGMQHDRALVTVEPRAAAAALADVPDDVLQQIAERHRPESPRHEGPQETLHDRVRRLLLEVLDRVEIDRDGDFSFAHGSTRVFVRLVDAPEEGAISVWAVTNAEVPATPELFEYIATNADRWLFGHLSAHLVEDGTAVVTFSHRLFGSFVQDEELLATLSVVASTADRIDEEIQQRFGGRIYADPPLAGEVPQREEELSTGMYL